MTCVFYYLKMKNAHSEVHGATAGLLFGIFVTWNVNVLESLTDKALYKNKTGWRLAEADRGTDNIRGLDCAEGVWPPEVDSVSVCAPEERY